MEKPTERVVRYPHGVELLEFGDIFECVYSKWSCNLECFYVLVEMIRCPNDVCFMLCGTLDDGSQLLSEYDDIQEVDDWHHKEFFNS